MRQRTRGYERQRCRAEGQAPHDAERTGRASDRPEAEGVLGDGRRPGPAQAAVFDETAAQAGLATRRRAPAPFLVATRRRATDGDGGSRHRASEVTSRARFAADKAAAGRRSAEELPIAAPPGPRGALFLTSDRSSGSGHASGLGRGRWLKLEGRRQATLHPKVRWRSQDRRRAGEGFARHPSGAGVRKDEGSGRVVREGASPGGRSRKGLPRSGHVRESDGPCWVHVVVSRLQKSERSTFLRGGSAGGGTRERFEAGGAGAGIV
jgi:hypothetical protein